jgi:hypothetical protein
MVSTQTTLLALLCCCCWAGAQVTLRQYQQEGISWLAFLHKFGLHGCLADDMVRGRLQALELPAAPLHVTALCAP